MSAGSFELKISMPSDDADVHAAILTDAHPDDMNIDGGTFTCTLKMTKGTEPPSSFNITPKHGNGFVTQQGCDVLRQAIQGETAAAVKDIIDWVGKGGSWRRGDSLGTKVVVEVGPEESTHQMEVTHALGSEPTRTDGNFTATVSFGFRRRRH